MAVDGLECPRALGAATSRRARWDSPRREQHLTSDGAIAENAVGGLPRVRFSAISEGRQSISWASSALMLGQLLDPGPGALAAEARLLDAAEGRDRRSRSPRC